MHWFKINVIRLRFKVEGCSQRGVVVFSEACPTGRTWNLKL